MDANGRNGQVHSGVSWSDGMEKTSIPGSIPGVLVVGHKAIVFFSDSFRAGWEYITLAVKAPLCVGKSTAAGEFHLL